MLPLIISIFVLVGQAAAAAAECSRSQLQQAAESYIAAVKSGSAALDVGIYTENFAPGKLSGGIHSKPIKTSLIHSLLDTTECATFTEIMAPQNAPPMVIGTQIRYAGSKITKMETVFNVRENGMFSNPALTYSYAVKENRGPIPQDKRDSRAVLKGIADAYFDKFTNG